MKSEQRSKLVMMVEEEHTEPNETTPQGGESRMPGASRLRLRRLPVSVQISFSSENIFGQGTVTNLSERGCLVDFISKRVPSGASLTLQLDLPGRQGSIKVDQAVVCWTKGQRFGVQFVGITPQDAGCLHRFLISVRR